MLKNHENQKYIWKKSIKIRRAIWLVSNCFTYENKWNTILKSRLFIFLRKSNLKIVPNNSCDS